MNRRLLQVVFAVLGLVRANNASLSFNAPLDFLTTAAEISVDQCGTTHNIKPVAVSSTDGQSPIFRISDSTGETTIFGVANNENLRCVDKSALEAAGVTTYTLTLEVSSATEPAVSFTFELTITGLVVNTNTPAFSPTTHSVTLSASRFDDEGQFSLNETFDVTDPDADAAGTVTYSLKDSPAEFDITSSSGTVSIQVKASTVDLSSPYELVVLATDGGSPPKTGTATITITFTSAAQGGQAEQEESSGANSNLGCDLGISLGTISGAGLVAGVGAVIYKIYYKPKGSIKPSSENTGGEKAETGKEKAERAETEMEKGGD